MDYTCKSWCKVLFSIVIKLNTLRVCTCVMHVHLCSVLSYTYVSTVCTCSNILYKCTRLLQYGCTDSNTNSWYSCTNFFACISSERSCTVVCYTCWFVHCTLYCVLYMTFLVFQDVLYNTHLHCTCTVAVFQCTSTFTAVPNILTPSCRW